MISHHVFPLNSCVPERTFSLALSPAVGPALWGRKCLRSFQGFYLKFC